MAKRDITQSAVFQEAERLAAEAQAHDLPTPPNGWDLLNSGVFETKPGKDDEPPRSEVSVQPPHLYDWGNLCFLPEGQQFIDAAVGPGG